MEAETKAKVVQKDDKYYIEIGEGKDAIVIPMSEDKSNEVKSAFNKLIVLLKGGPIKIVLDQIGEDLFSQVANEYITQLNREILEVYGEMKQHNLCVKP